ncbi:MAG: hypothetical protein NUV67_06275 [archaeon]|nr:hypothetical protein [archaeon]
MKTSSQKAQAVLMDFALAVLIFVVAWFFIATQFQERDAQVRGDADFLEMRIKADYALDYLARSPGEPSGWETLEIGDLNRPGLAISDRRLFEQKLAAFSNHSADYELLRQKMNIGRYDFFFEFDGIDNSSAGLAPGGDATKIVLSRIVEYKGGEAIAKLTLYELE